MHDSRFEDLLRNALREDAAALPMSVSADLLQRRLAERRRQTRNGRRWLAAAAVVALAVTGGVAILSQFQGNYPPIGASPSPSASQRVPLPDASSLLADFPDATLRLEQSVGPADRPVSPGASAPPDASPAPVEVGRVRFAGPFVIGVACLGEGELLVEVTTPSIDGFPYTHATAPCDGRPVYSEYLSMPIDPASDGDVVSVTVSAGTSWRLALGEYPASLMTPPDFSPIELTSGWSLVSNVPPVLVTSKTGARVAMPDDATRAGVYIQCQGAGFVSLEATGSAPTEIECAPSGPTRRIEFPAIGGEPLTLGVTVDGSRVWVRFIVEANAELGSTYPSAPPIPPAVAAVPYMAPDASVVGFGTLGSSRQTILPIQGARPGQPAGDLLPVAVSDETAGARLDLVSVSGGTVLRTLATVPAPSFIFDSWVDATHEQVFYGVSVESGIEFHRVATLGAGDQVVATVERDQTGFSADLAIDDSVFVVGACFEGGGCVRTIVDAATGKARQVDLVGDPVCKILGIVDGLIVGTSRAVCAAESTTAVVAVPIEGGSPRVLIDDAPRPEIGGAVVVSTLDGPKVVFTGSVQPGGITAIEVLVLDVTTGETAALPPSDVGDARLFPYQVRLPDGWLLLAGGFLGDYPWQRSFDRPAPVLVNLVTGERIELVNLPHWVGDLPN